VIWLFLSFLSSPFGQQKVLPSVTFRTTSYHSLLTVYSEKKFLLGFRLSTALPWPGWGMQHVQHLIRHTQNGHIPEIVSAFDSKPQCLLQVWACHVISNFITLWHTHKQNYRTIYPQRDMQPAASMEPDLKRHPYALIFLPSLTRPCPNPCHNCLVAQDSSGACTGCE
jgi:hypothetical protein